MQPAYHTPDLVHYFTDLLQQHLGFSLLNPKQHLLTARLSPILETHGIATLESLAHQLQHATNQALLRDVLDAMTTGETYFYRNEDSFITLRESIIPILLKAATPRRSLHLWSAGCSTGQEACSLAMTMATMPGYATEWKADILATDVSNAAVARTTSAEYSNVEVARGLPEAELQRHFTRIDKNTWKLNAALRNCITARQHNLLTPLESDKKFDLILCRNVFIYFDYATKQCVLNHLTNQLAPHGVLMLARTDSISGLHHKLRPLANFTNIFTLVSD